MYSTGTLFLICTSISIIQGVLMLTMDVEEKKSVQLPCKHGLGRENITEISWYKTSEGLSSVATYRPQIDEIVVTIKRYNFTNPIGTLNISVVSIEDDDIFTCRVRDALGNTLQRVVTLSVVVTPKNPILTGLEKQLAGSSTTVRCDVLRVKPDQKITISWKLGNNSFIGTFSSETLNQDGKTYTAYNTFTFPINRTIDGQKLYCDVFWERHFVVSVSDRIRIKEDGNTLTIAFLGAFVAAFGVCCIILGLFIYCQRQKSAAVTEVMSKTAEETEVTSEKIYNTAIDGKIAIINCSPPSPEPEYSDVINEFNAFGFSQTQGQRNNQEDMDETKYSSLVIIILDFNDRAKEAKKLLSLFNKQDNSGRPKMLIITTKCNSDQDDISHIVPKLVTTAQDQVTVQFAGYEIRTSGKILLESMRAVLKETKEQLNAELFLYKIAERLRNNAKETNATRPFYTSSLTKEWLLTRRRLPTPR